MSVKLIVCDIDGTLLPHTQILSKENENAISQALSKGIIVTIASGRSYFYARKIHKPCKMNGPIVALNGAVVKDPILTYRDIALDSSALVPAFEFAKEHDLIFNIVEGDITTLISVDKPEFEKLHFDMAKSFNKDLSHVKVMQYQDFLDNIENIRANKVALCSYDTNFLREKRKLFDEYVTQTDIPELADITSSYWNNFELMPKQIDKGSGVMDLSKAYGLSYDEIMCIGDNENDISMFEKCKYSIAMGNASSEVKKHAAYVTGNCEDNGVANAIIKFAL